MKPSKTQISMAIRAILESLNSHLDWVEKPIPKNQKFSIVSHAYQIRAIKEYAYIIKLLTDFL